MREYGYKPEKTGIRGGVMAGDFEGDSVKETCRRIRIARSYWDAHNNGACRRERERALELYGTLSAEEKKLIPQVLLVWLRYRSEKYFGEGRTAPKGRTSPKKRISPKGR